MAAELAAQDGLTRIGVVGYSLDPMFQTAIDKQCALVADLNGDIRTRPPQQMHVSLNLERLDFEFRKIRIQRNPCLAGRPDLLCALLTRNLHG